MIKIDRQMIVQCDTCKEPAIRRFVPIHLPGVLTADVFYDTHSENLASDEHHEAIKRLDLFYMKAGEILAQVRQRAAEQEALSVGLIVSYDLDTVPPTACKRRQEIILIALIRAYGLTTEVQTEPLMVDEFDFESSFAQIREKADEASQRLKERYEGGKF
jgi:hypothetical protein